MPLLVLLSRSSVLFRSYNILFYESGRQWHGGRGFMTEIYAVHHGL